MRISEYGYPHFYEPNYSKGLPLVATICQKKILTFLIKFVNRHAFLVVEIGMQPEQRSVLA